MRVFPLLATAALVTAALTHGEPPRRASVFINPVKPFVGLGNIGVDCAVSDYVSLVAFTEVAFWHSPYLTSVVHPNAVLEIGIQGYPLAHVGHWPLDGLSAGIGGVLTFNEHRAPTRVSKLALFELSWRFLLGERFYLRPRVKGYAYLDGSGSNFFGAELFVGFRF